ncbi:hypothetical protein GCM10014713_07680 [Streptomyces purpureus]|uniref:Transposase n=1 Tax=Streptomyces purpureus TaxID=1951 RepID=A0A918GXF7_9ACTN|nr:hypothetical protein GCM10014713_07680 [Streptomyces purpureus]
MPDPARGQAHRRPGSPPAVGETAHAPLVIGRIDRYERKADHFLAFVGIAAALICHRRLTK